MILIKRATALVLVLVLLVGVTACASQPPIAETQPTISYEPHSCSGVDPYVGMSKEEFYADYTPACCNQDAKHRSKHGFLSGLLEVPGQYVQEAQNRPQSQGQFVRNTGEIYLDDGNTYVVLDSNGNEALRIHKAGGYITLEEVAAYMYAFGGDQLPANYTSKKSSKPQSSIWGEYLRPISSTFRLVETIMLFPAKSRSLSKVYSAAVTKLPGISVPRSSRISRSQSIYRAAAWRLCSSGENRFFSNTLNSWEAVS
jgi:hypothetical protein